MLSWRKVSIIKKKKGRCVHIYAGVYMIYIQTNVTKSETLKLSR